MSLVALNTSSQPAQAAPTLLLLTEAMAAPSHSQQPARQLISDYVKRLHENAPYKWKLSLSTHGEPWGAMLPRATWIVVPLQGGDSFADTMERVMRTRALVEVVGRLSASSALKWVDFYDAFWKPVLLAPINAWRSHRSFVTEFDCLERLDGASAPKFMLDFTGDIVPNPDCLALLRAFLLGDVEPAIGEPHRSVLANLKEEASNLCSSPPFASDCAPPRVELGITLSMSGAWLGLLQKLPRLLKDVESYYDKRDDPTAVRFDVSTISISGSSMTESSKMYELADVFAPGKLPTRHLYIEPCYFSFKCIPIEAFQAFLYRVLSVKSLNPVLPRLQTLHFARPPFSHHHVVATCSVLRSSSLLKDVNLGIMKEIPSDSRVVWAWIAFGVFHSDSKARLDRLGLPEIAITEEDVDVFRSVLCSPTPGKVLWEIEHGPLPTTGGQFEEVLIPENTRVLAQIGVDTTIRVYPTAHSKVLVPFALDTDEFEVVIRLAAWACIVVPGYGLGWILSSAIRSQRHFQSRCVRVPQDDPISRTGDESRHVKLLFRTSPSGAMPVTGLLRLLKTIGGGLEGLDLTCQPIGNMEFRDILVSCPNLTLLNLAGNFRITDFSPLLEAYRESRCKITTLMLNAFGTSAESVSQMAVLLADSIHSKPLRYLAIGTARDSKPLEELALALRENRTLQVLSLFAPRAEGTTAESRRAFDGALELIQFEFAGAQHKHRARSSMKTAFLSAIQHDGNGHSPSLKQLDSCIVANIFAFAATSIGRQLILNNE